MKAAVYHGPMDVRVEDVPEPALQPGTVKVAVAFNGICGTDLHEVYGGPQFIPTPKAPHPRTGNSLPVIMGHEFSGTITEVGPDVTHLHVGDRVAVEPLRTCGTCVACASGNYNACSTVTVVGIAGGPGGLAEFAVVPADKAHPLPDEVNLDAGALVEPMAVSYHAVRLANPQPGQTALVFGAGPIGLGAALALRALGLEQVIVVETAPARRAILANLGIETVDPRTQDLLELVRERTNGQGVDLAVDCAGLSVTFQPAIQSVRPHGTVVLVAMSPTPVAFIPSTLNLTEVTIRGSHTYLAQDYRDVIALMAKGAYPIDSSWVTHADLDDIMSDGFEVLHRGEAMKVLIDVANLNARTTVPA